MSIFKAFINGPFEKSFNITFIENIYKKLLKINYFFSYKKLLKILSISMHLKH